MKTSRIIIIVVLMLIALIIATYPMYAQCAMCKASVESQTNSGKSLGSGLNTAILYLMSLPYILFGTVGYLWYRNSRKK